MKMANSAGVIYSDQMTTDQWPKWLRCDRAKHPELPTEPPLSRMRRRTEKASRGGEEVPRGGDWACAFADRGTGS